MSLRAPERERATLLERVAQIEAVRAALRNGQITRHEAARRLGGMGRAVYVRDLWERYEKGLGETADGLRHAWATRLAPHFAELEVWELDEGKVRVWWRELSRHYAPASCRVAWDTLKASYKLALATGDVVSLPWGTWKPPRTDTLNPREAAVTLAELVQLLERCKADDEAARARGRYSCRLPLVATLTLCGLRQREAAALGWDAVAIDAPPNTLEVWFQARDGWAERYHDRPRDPAKGKARRSQVMHASLVEILRAHRAELERRGWYRESGPVFPAPGGAWHRGDVLQPSVLRQIAKRAGLVGWERWTTHSTRHTFGTLEARGSGDLRATARRTGHASLGVLEGYIHASARGAPPPAIPALPPSVLPSVRAELAPARAPRELPPAGSDGSPRALGDARSESMASLAAEWIAEAPDSDQRRRALPTAVVRAARIAYARGYTRARRAGGDAEACRLAARRARQASIAAWWALVERVRRP